MSLELLRFTENRVTLWALGNSLSYLVLENFPGGSVVKNPSANAGDLGSIPRLGRSPGEGNGNPLQYFYLRSHGQRSLEVYSQGVAKESDTA